MAFPKDIRVIDTMLGIPAGPDRSDWYSWFAPLIRDRETRENFKMPAQYMFRNIPDIGEEKDYIGWTVGQMDAHNIETALVGCNAEGIAAKKRFPGRFLLDLGVDPNAGMEDVARIRSVHAEVGLSAVSVFPSGTYPQVPINHKYMFPIYTVCSELGLPIFLNVGVPGPRIPMEPQKVEYLDEICWFFPDLKVVMRHGAEPWQDLAVKLMLKWPNLYYSTSAFAPRHYPKEIIHFGNTRGADKLIYAGYFPMGLSLDRIFRELQDVGFKDEVWPKFLRENALKVLKAGA